MSSITIALPENMQLQSPLMRLPPEIKHIIYGYCFVTDGPIIDPVVDCARPKEEQKPKLGVNLLRTCRRVYHEADRRPLFTQNTFRFTTVDRVRCFIKSLAEPYRACVQDIEIDARRVHCDHPGIAREWLHYLAWGGGTWSEILGSLRMDAPGLRCLRLNFESWPSIPMFRAELWNLLRSMLLQVEGLERIVVIGASKGKGMAMREPWSPVHFVGGDDVGSDDLVQRMWKVVGAQDDLVKHVEKNWAGSCKREKSTDPWPENGSCTWLQYQNRKSDVAETMQRVSPNAGE